MMKPFLTTSLLGAAAFVVPMPGQANAAGFTDSDIVFYGEVRQFGGAGTVVLQSGELVVTFANQSDSANRVTLRTRLEPTGTGPGRPFSYSLKVPLAYLPAPQEKSGVLSIGSQETQFKIESIEINGSPATLPDGSREFFPLSFASRASQQRIDLIVAGDSTDTDGDGLPDWWEEMHGLDPLVDDAEQDSDADGWSNSDEFDAGSDPNVSNREPTLATREILVPESGKAGVYFTVLDSDTVPAEQVLALTVPADGGFEFQFDGAAAIPGEHQFSLADLAAGRLVVSHQDASVTEAVLQTDLGAVVVRAEMPSAVDGRDAALWLDAGNLAGTGHRLDQWLDRSGNGNGVFQPRADYRPQVVEHESGRTTLDFSQSDDAHLFFPDRVLPQGDHTILIAYQAGASSDSTQTLFASNRGFFHLTPTTEAISYPGSAVYQADGSAVRAYENVLVRSTATSVFRREADLLQHISGISYDGEASPPVDLEPLLPTIGGGRAATSGEGDVISDPFSGQLHELLVFPIALPEQKLRDVTDYLESKWSDSVVWDFSTQLRAVSVSLQAGSQPNIIRGGHGDDRLGGGEADDVISGGFGDDRLIGGGGADCFVFGNLDTGRDVIVDYDLEADTIDLSALFWGMTGDARDYVSVRLETNFSSEVPSLDSVLVIKLPAGGEQEILLQGVVIGAPQLVQSIVEGRIRMGGLSIPADVQITRSAPGVAVREHLGETFEIELSRTGDSSGAALEVPIGFFRDALGSDLIIVEAGSQEGRRAVVTFARGETTKTLTVRPLSDLITEGAETWGLAAIPHFRYSISGDSVQQVVSDVPLVWLELTEGNGVASIDRPSRIILRRDGDLAAGLPVPIWLGGTAAEGTHFAALPDQIMIPAGQASAEIAISALPALRSTQTQMVLVTIADNANYQLSNPHEVSVYLVEDEAQTEELGFDAWLASHSAGQFSGLEDLSASDVAIYLKQYATGSHRLGFRIVEGHPEISLLGSPRPDIAWAVHSSSALQGWRDDSGRFVMEIDSAGQRFLGPEIGTNRQEAFYRLEPNLTLAGIVGKLLRALAGSSSYASFGDGAWSGHLQEREITNQFGEHSRITTEVAGATTLDFELEIRGGDGSDRLIFFIDGVEIAQTAGAATRVLQVTDDTSPHLLTWEFHRSSGEAVIRNLTPSP